MKQTMQVTSTDGRIFDVDISPKACLKCGFLHGDIAIYPNGSDEIKIAGVAPGNDGSNVLWYEIVHPRTKGKVCYWGGEFPNNLIKAGFVKKID